MIRSFLAFLAGVLIVVLLSSDLSATCTGGSCPRGGHCARSQPARTVLRAARDAVVHRSRSVLVTRGAGCHAGQCGRWHSRGHGHCR